MARNSEKRLSGLNRFLEAKEREKNEGLQRPPLHQLLSAEDVKSWIPSIQKEINYLLMQIEGTGSRKHKDSKIKEFHEKIEQLEHEHKRFVAKVRALDPSYRDVMPWQPRAYSRKRREGGSEGGRGGGSVPQAKKLFSPLLDAEKSLPSESPPLSSHHLTTQPINFHPVTNDGRSNYSPVANRGCVPTSTSPAAIRTDAVETTCDPETVPVTSQSRSNVDVHSGGSSKVNTSLVPVTSESRSNVDVHSGDSTKVITSMKYVDYSSSSEDESA